MPYQLSTTTRSMAAQATQMYAITRTAKANGKVYYDIAFKLAESPTLRGESFEMHLPAGTPLARVINARDILRKAIADGMITDRAAWKNLVGQLVRAIKTRNKSATPTDVLSA